MHNISLHPNTESPTAYYVRILSPEKKVISKLFNFNGNQEKARYCAKVYRDTVRFEFWGQVGLTPKRYIDSTGARRKGTIYKDGYKGTSGSLGVSYQERPYGNGGLRKMWIATWRENGKISSKSFTFNGLIGAAKHRTSDDAKQLAIQHRGKMEKLHYKD